MLPRGAAGESPACVSVGTRLGLGKCTVPGVLGQQHQTNGWAAGSSWAADGVEPVEF